LLLERWEAVPVLAMLRQSAEEVRARATRFVADIPELRAEILPGESVTGGGATPEQTIPTWVIAVQCADVVEAERRLREADPPVVARVENGRLVFDLRTVPADDEAALARALAGLGEATSGP